MRAWVAEAHSCCSRRWCGLGLFRLASLRPLLAQDASTFSCCRSCRSGARCAAGRAASAASVTASTACDNWRQSYYQRPLEYMDGHCRWAVQKLQLHGSMAACLLRDKPLCFCQLQRPAASPRLLPPYVAEPERGGSHQPAHFQRAVMLWPAARSAEKGARVHVQVGHTVWQDCGCLCLLRAASVLVGLAELSMCSPVAIAACVQRVHQCGHTTRQHVTRLSARRLAADDISTQYISYHCQHRGGIVLLAELLGRLQPLPLQWS